MRTTVTLDDDVAAELVARQRAERRSFKAVLNETLRAGLHPASPAGDATVVYTHPRPLGARVDISDVSAVIAMLDEEKYAHLAHPPRS